MSLLPLSLLPPIVPQSGARLRVLRGSTHDRSPGCPKTVAPCYAISVRMRIFAALGDFAFPSYRPAKFSGENAPAFAVFLPVSPAWGAQFRLRSFSARKPANAVLKTCKKFKVIHVFRIFAFPVFCALLPTGFRLVLSRRRSRQLGGMWSTV
jgi:hypothetical protein